VNANGEASREPATSSDGGMEAMSEVVVAEAGRDQAAEVLHLVSRLLAELGEEGEETGALDQRSLTKAWASEDRRHLAFLARHGSRTVGVMTVSEAFALYAQGHYGVINEMFVLPEYRSRGVGAMLLDAAKALGQRRGWRRIDVTAPESIRWDRTRRFYERQGFQYTGPKLKFLLTQEKEVR
jgi:GNAT superfamily N-acetyltransferase